MICNGELRIDAMLDLARRLGCSALATGHYAGSSTTATGCCAPPTPPRIRPTCSRGCGPNRWRAYASRSPSSQARGAELAAAAGLPVASKAESQDLCFLAGEGKRSFLARHGGLAGPGAIVDRGRRLGEHRGHHEFTVGQRRGIGVGGSEPLYVLRTDAATNEVVVGTREELARRRVHVREATLHRPGGRVDRVRLRYREAARLRAPRVPAGEHDGSSSSSPSPPTA